MHGDNLTTNNSTNIIPLLSLFASVKCKLIRKLKISSLMLALSWLHSNKSNAIWRGKLQISYEKNTLDLSIIQQLSSDYSLSHISIGNSVLANLIELIVQGTMTFIHKIEKNSFKKNALSICKMELHLYLINLIGIFAEMFI